MMANLSEDLYSECNTAKNALSHLPIEQMNLSGAYKFLSQAADYAGYLSSKTKSGTEISDEEYENIALTVSKINDTDVIFNSIVGFGHIVVSKSLQISRSYINGIFAKIQE